jgi:hypothetical protein
LFPINHSQQIIILKNKYFSLLSECPEIQGEWLDNYVHLEYWEKGFSAIPSRQAESELILKSSSEKIMYLATRPFSVYGEIFLEDSYEFHGQIELQNVQALYDEIILSVSCEDPAVICIPN